MFYLEAARGKGGGKCQSLFGLSSNELQPFAFLGQMTNASVAGKPMRSSQCPLGAE